MGKLTRRAFLITGAAAGATVVGGLVVGVGYLSTIDTQGLTGVLDADGTVRLNAWLQIAPDGKITFAVPRTEMGQGVHTALPMLIAEELEVSLDRDHVAVEHPVAELPVYTNFTLGLDVRPEQANGPLYWVGKRLFALFPFIATGGSTSVVSAWYPLRVAGASARLMLTAAAADAWGVPASECVAEEGHIVHRGSDRRFSYGELAKAAAQKAPTPNPPLKPASEFKLIGKSIPRLDVPAKVTGEAEFGIDVVLPDMLYAAIRQSPVFGGTVKSMEAAAVEDREGVVKVVNLGDAVAVVADSYWRAQQAVQALAVEFDANGNGAISSTAFRAEMRTALDRQDAHAFRDDGDVEQALQETERALEAVYETPLLAHACMEPMNCTARYQDGSAELWIGAQSPLTVRFGAQKGAEISGSVTTHIMLTGGGFGRRVEGDVARQATALAAAVPGRPVKLIWSREEDIQHDMYRPHAISRFRAALGQDGLPVVWHNRIVTQSVDQSFGNRNLPFGGDDGAKDKLSVEGAEDLAYAIPNQRVELVDVETPVPVGFWRSVGHSNNAFFTESFLDECAHAAGQDPLEYRRKLLRDQPRYLEVLDILAERSDWGQPLGPDRGRGVALHRSFRSIVAQVAEVTVDPAGQVAVDRVVCVIDCGTVIHPDTVKAQMEGGIVYGLSALLFGEITVEQGRVQQSNFHDYNVVRMPQTPLIETHIVPSAEPPGGVGEPGVPPILPAVTNAIFAATGQRIRALPLALAQKQVTIG